MAQTMISMSAVAPKPFVAAPRTRQSSGRPQRHIMRGAGDDNAPEKKGVTWGVAAKWPPQPFTEHGQPREEDDPKNYKGSLLNQEYTGSGDVEKMRKEVRDRNPFSKKQSGGTQIGGGGEGSAS